MIKIISFLISLISLNFLSSAPALAQCPVCVVTVGGGMLIAEKLGVDDLLVSIWISALNVALSFWLAPKIKIKYLNHPLVFMFLMLFSTLAYFQFTDQIGVPGNNLLNIDKIILGQILGTMAMVGGNITYIQIKKKLGHTPFPYAKVVLPLITVLVITLIFKFTFNL